MFWPSGVLRAGGVLAFAGPMLRLHPNLSLILSPSLIDACAVTLTQSRVRGPPKPPAEVKKNDRRAERYVHGLADERDDEKMGKEEKRKGGKEGRREAMRRSSKMRASDTDRERKGRKNSTDIVSDHNDDDDDADKGRHRRRAVSARGHGRSIRTLSDLDYRDGLFTVERAAREDERLRVRKRAKTLGQEPLEGGTQRYWLAGERRRRRGRLAIAMGIRHRKREQDRRRKRGRVSKRLPAAGRSCAENNEFIEEVYRMRKQEHRDQKRRTESTSQSLGNVGGLRAV
ncbi:hypothetical protein DFH11DRAFT_1548889 [Phellopilus nigrolimitatus]|nr:hypothetical protein DFH11DRAFT_1548889 [Phellopilus nigrolimitatus]